LLPEERLLLLSLHQRNAGLLLRLLKSWRKLNTISGTNHLHLVPLIFGSGTKAPQLCRQAQI